MDGGLDVASHRAFALHLLQPNCDRVGLASEQVFHGVRQRARGARGGGGQKVGTCRGAGSILVGAGPVDHRQTLQSAVHAVNNDDHADADEGNEVNDDDDDMMMMMMV